MLPAQRRVHRREDFSAAVRNGARIGSPGLVVHVSNDASWQPARAGFIVGRAVGPAVRRNRLRRQLRHLVAPRLAQLPPGTMLVMRATQPAADSTGRELATSVETLLDRTLRAVS
jgi:ribonuclease P protein component